MVYCRDCNKIYGHFVVEETVESLTRALKQKLAPVGGGFELSTIETIGVNDGIIYHVDIFCPVDYKLNEIKTHDVVAPIAFSNDGGFFDVFGEYADDINLLKTYYTDKDEEIIDLSLLSTDQLISIQGVMKKVFNM